MRDNIRIFSGCVLLVIVNGTINCSLNLDSIKNVVQVQVKHYVCLSLPLFNLKVLNENSFVVLSLFTDNELVPYSPM